MSEWLTTGQMIDRLKIGEVAECETGERVKLFKNINTLSYEGLQEAICWISDNDKPIPFYLSKGNINVKWRILPKYVSFEKAIEALKDGKTVNCFLSNMKYTYKQTDKGILYKVKIYEEYEEGYCEHVTWKEIFYGNWQIVD